MKVRSCLWPGLNSAQTPLVDMDVFANNRLSLILLEENPVKHMVMLHVEAVARGASVFYDTLKDPKIAYSYEPTIAPTMYATNKEGTEGTFFDWMAKHVCPQMLLFIKPYSYNVLVGRHTRGRDFGPFVRSF